MIIDNACLSVHHARESRLNVQDIEICSEPHDRTMPIVSWYQIS